MKIITKKFVFKATMLCLVLVVFFSKYSSIQPFSTRETYSNTQSNDTFLSTLFNPLRVEFTGKRRSGEMNVSDIICSLTNTPISILEQSMKPYQDNGLAKYFPRRSLFDLYNKKFNKCAVVSSSSFMTNSGLGQEIDAHDAVLRFNNAPTVGYERDVGNKTTIRFVNIDTMHFPDFTSSDIYTNVTMVSWYEAPYTFTPYKWYEHNGGAFYEIYTKIRRSKPAEHFYVIDPKWNWKIWDIIQENTEEDIYKHAPSSGFTGILLMQALCNEVHVYGFVTPSIYLLHYYTNNNYINGPTGFLWHPMAQEKKMIEIMNIGPDTDKANKGKITLPGFNPMHCQ